MLITADFFYSWAENSNQFQLIKLDPINNSNCSNSNYTKRRRNLSSINKYSLVTQVTSEISSQGTWYNTMQGIDESISSYSENSDHLQKENLFSKSIIPHFFLNSSSLINFHHHEIVWFHKKLMLKRRFLQIYPSHYHSHIPSTSFGYLQ